MSKCYVFVDNPFRIKVLVRNPLLHAGFLLHVSVQLPVALYVNYFRLLLLCPQSATGPVRPRRHKRLRSEPVAVDRLDGVRARLGLGFRRRLRAAAGDDASLAGYWLQLVDGVGWCCCRWSTRRGGGLWCWGIRRGGRGRPRTGAGPTFVFWLAWPVVVTVVSSTTFLVRTEINRNRRGNEKLSSERQSFNTAMFLSWNKLLPSVFFYIFITLKKKISKSAYDPLESLTKI